MKSKKIPAGKAKILFKEVAPHSHPSCFKAELMPSVEAGFVVFSILQHSSAHGLAAFLVHVVPETLPGGGRRNGAARLPELQVLLGSKSKESTELRQK